FALIDDRLARFESEPRSLPAGMDEALSRPVEDLRVLIDGVSEDELERASLEDVELLAPLGRDQEVWAGGVTYWRSLEARTAESEQRTVYDLVYDAERPELFFKALPRRVAGPGGQVAIRSDSSWNVPEPE